MTPVLRATILFSLLLHLLLYIWYASSVNPIFAPQKQTELTRQFSLAPPIPTESINQSEPPTPKHMEDDPTKANTSNGDTEDGDKYLQNLEQGEGATHKYDKTSISTTAMLSQALNSLEIEKHTQHNDSTKFSETNEEVARWRNEVLKAIEDHIDYLWVKPENSSPYNQGVIGITIDGRGYLERAWIIRVSGDRFLDESALRAIRNIWRFPIPEADLYRGYYRNLTYRYSGG